MPRIQQSTRISLCLTFLSLTSLLLAGTFRFLPSEPEFTLKTRISQCESLALACSALAEKNDVAGIEHLLRSFAARNPEVLSAALRDARGNRIAQIGDHARHWSPPRDGRSTSDSFYVPITSGTETWGRVEVAFQPVAAKGWRAWPASRWTTFVTFVTCVNMVVFWWWLRRVLIHLDPSRAVPSRVRSALDTIGEGLLVLDEHGRIMLANRAFTSNLQLDPDAVQGRPISELSWFRNDPESESEPWMKCLRNNQECVGVPLGMKARDRQWNFIVNTSPIRDDAGRPRGVLVSLGDVTALEQKKAELLRMLESLRASRDMIREQNEKLHHLATRDPLTGCLNRRSLFEKFQEAWNASMQTGNPLSALMVDVDHFKSVNDNHGHAMGDEVLKKVAATLLSGARESDIVGRFGGEEFCIVLPNTSLDEAYDIAERFRLAIADLQFDKLSVTASLGGSSTAQHPSSPEELLEQADKCLYVAKRNGRNQVVRFDQVRPEQFEEKEVSTRAGDRPSEADDAPPSIPYQAVTSLLTALAYRDTDTAQHSLRVADLCAAMARRLMSVKDTFVLETAALLHDIGKIGVPDAILLKPGRLTDEEWQVMRLHDRIGVEIIRASFANETLAEIVRYHHLPFQGDPSQPTAPRGEEIPLAARILTIADAFDAMVSDRVYRPGRSQEEAFAELRRCAGRQFDPKLVECFMEVVRDRGTSDVRRECASRDVTLHIGQQIERLADAVDQHDVFALAALAARLEACATKQKIPEVRDVAARLRAMALEDPDLTALVATTHELMDLCRGMQRRHVEVDLPVRG